MNTGETVFDLPRLCIYLDHVQVIIMKCMSRNVRWTTSVKCVNTILQNLAKSTKLWIADGQDGLNLTFWKSTLDQIHDDPFWLLPFSTRLICFRRHPIDTNFVDCILADFGNDPFQCICLPILWWSMLPLNHSLMGTTNSAQSTWYLLGS